MNLNKVIIGICLVLASFAVNAQNNKLKLAHISSVDLIDMMPATKDADAQLKEYEASLHKTYESIYKEYEQMVLSYQQGGKDMPEVTRGIKEEEIREKMQKLEKLEREMPQLLQKKRETLYTPILEKAQQAIQDVAKENGYSYVLDSSPGSGLIFYENGDDLLPLVKKKLGLDAASSTTPTPPANGQ